MENNDSNCWKIGCQWLLLPRREGGAVTWRELLEKGKEALTEAGIEDARLDAWYLLEYVSHMGRADYFLHQEEKITSEECSRYFELLERRSRHMPLQYLTGIQEFMGLTFKVSQDVLIPRQDTELLVELLLPACRGKRILDLCTGSGCIAVSLAKLGSPDYVAAADISEAALKIAEQNAEKMDAPVCFWQSDLYDKITGSYDIIVSNPPYIRSDTLDTLMPEVRAFEPELALDGGEDGLDFYRRIVRGARQHLEREGILAVEIGFDQADDVKKLFEENDFCHIASHKDLCGLDRVVTGCLCKYNEY